MKNLLLKFYYFLPSALILVTALSAYFGGYYFFVGLTAAVVLLLHLRKLRRHSPNRADLLWLVMPLWFLLGLFGTVSASSLGMAMFFAVLGSFFFYFYHRHYPSPIPLYIEQTFNLYGAFLLAVFLWSLNFFFTPPWWVTSLLMAVGFFPLFWQAFYKMGQPPRAAALGALIATLIITELSWAVLFWPVHFFTAAVVSFAAFYLMYMFSHLYFKGRLNRRKIYFQVSLITIVVIITLVSSSWQPINRI